MPEGQQPQQDSEIIPVNPGTRVVLLCQDMPSLLCSYPGSSWTTFGLHCRGSAHGNTKRIALPHGSMTSSQARLHRPENPTVRNTHLGRRGEGCRRWRCWRVALQLRTRLEPATQTPPAAAAWRQPAEAAAVPGCACRHHSGSVTLRNGSSMSHSASLLHLLRQVMYPPTDNQTCGTFPEA